MSVKYLSGYYSGYSITSPTTVVTVTASGVVRGSGIFAPTGTYTVVNLGGISGSTDGVYLQGPGSVTNGGPAATSRRITGGSEGVRIHGLGTVANWGTILDYENGLFIAPAVYLLGGGAVNNGSGQDNGALIQGAYGVFAINAAATVLNYGSIVATGGNGSPGVGLDAGGLLVNGSGDDTTAFVGGATGFKSQGAAATVINFGSIIGFNRQFGIYLYAGGTISNGSAADTHARISGADGVYVRNAAGTVTNFGAIESTGALLGGDAVKLADGGRITNGAATDHTALISGYEVGVELIGSAVVTNYGTLQGLGTNYRGLGASLGGGGDLVNGAGSDPAALIEGYNGISVAGSAAQVRNFGSIIGWGGASGFGVELYKVGTLYNGTANDRAALIEGYDGLELVGVAAAANFGVVVGTGAAGGAGVYLTQTGARFTNGSATVADASVTGYEGVRANGADTVINFGTISGADGVAVDFVGAGGDLVVEAGSRFLGAVYGAGGVLDLAGGAGTLTGLLGASGDVTVSGSMATTTFSEFGAVRIDSGASFTLPSASIAAGKSFIVIGTATTAGTLTSAGVLTVVGALPGTGILAGTGTLAIIGGTASFIGGPSLTIAKVTQSGGTASFGGTAVAVSHPWTQTGGTITAPTGDRVNFSGVGDVFSGTLAGAGAIAFTGGTDALAGATLSAANMVAAGGSLTLSGAITLSKTLTVASPNLTIAAGGATLSGGGALYLNTATTSAVIGASAAAALTNKEVIEGAGQLGDGQLTIVNAAGGIIAGFLTTGLTINTGAGSLSNAGLIENTNTGGTTITGAVSNTGTLLVSKGVLMVDGAVSGAGIVKIAGGTADFGGTFTENVTFTGTTGVLELSHSQTYTGAVTGLSAAPGGSTLDLLDITFASGTTKATFSGTVTSGTLTVTNGTHTAKITLIGNYVGHAFTTASDGHGGTTVADPAASGTGHVTPLVTAMATFGGQGAASAAMVPIAHRTTYGILAAPA